MPPPPEPSLAAALSAELQALGRTGLLRIYGAGDVIFSTGDPGDGLYLIESGRVEVIAMVAGNEPRPLATLGAGDFLGEMAVLDAAPRSATARAATPTQARFLSRDEFLELLDRRPALALSLIREFSRRMRALNQKYLDEIVQAEVLAAVGRFAGTIVHDFKAPLSVIGLSAEMAGREKTSPEGRAKAAAGIAKQVTRMTTMLNELIEITRPSGPTGELAAGDFAAFLTPLLEDLQPEVTGRGHVLVLAGPPPALSVRLDPQRLARLFYNLVNNAMDEMKGGGTITLRFIPEPDALRVEVQDTGRGIAPEIAEKLFQPFATHGKTHGTGLGLSICKKIAESHGGRIWARSDPGQGATFCFTLPLA
jgi:signal transduction histidine kinase